ncbi:4-hydroxythreonine-4-phosphate dehydrogenase PdxA, partial [bacterium]|nr:4-hydroxythreonine-4-phosphate dehydrogenase PdxA [bacterium]
MKKKIAISCGDPAGIGYEVVAKSLPAFAESGFGFVLFGAAGVFKRLAEKFDWAHQFWDMVRGGRFEFVDLGDDADFPVERIDPRCGEVAFKSILAAAQTCLRGEAGGLVTAPVSKRAIQLAGHPDFFGHTEFLGKIFGAETTMMLFSGDFRVALVTTHIPIRRV